MSHVQWNSVQNEVLYIKKAYFQTGTVNEDQILFELAIVQSALTCESAAVF